MFYVFDEKTCGKYRLARLAEKARRRQKMHEKAGRYQLRHSSGKLASKLEEQACIAIAKDYGMQEVTSIESIGVLGYAVRGIIVSRKRKYLAIASIDHDHNRGNHIVFFRQKSSTRPMKVDNFALPKPHTNYKIIYGGPIA